MTKVEELIQRIETISSLCDPNDNRTTSALSYFEVEQSAVDDLKSHLNNVLNVLRRAQKKEGAAKEALDDITSREKKDLSQSKELLSQIRDRIEGSVGDKEDLKDVFDKALKKYDELDETYRSEELPSSYDEASDKFEKVSAIKQALWTIGEALDKQIQEEQKDESDNEDAKEVVKVDREKLQEAIQYVEEELSKLEARSKDNPPKTAKKILQEIRSEADKQKEKLQNIDEETSSKQRMNAFKSTKAKVAEWRMNLQPIMDVVQTESKRFRQLGKIDGNVEEIIQSLFEHKRLFTSS